MRCIIAAFLSCSLFATACFTPGHGDEHRSAASSSPCQCKEQNTNRSAKSHKGAKPQMGGTVTIRIATEPGVLIPMFSTDNTVRRIVEHDVLEALVIIDDKTKQPSPELARGWQIDDTKTIYTFYLEEDATWHDGTPVTGGDVTYTFSKLLDPAGGAVIRTSFLDIAAVDEIDEQTISIKLDKPRPGFLKSLSEVHILPRHVFGNNRIQSHPAARAPIGSGPFVFSEWKMGQAIELVKNESWRDAPPYLDKIVYRLVPDRRVAMELFRGGELDILPGVGNTKKLNTGWVYSYSLSSFDAWIFNTQKKIFASSGTRKAVGMLIDREVIRCSILGCLATIIDNPWPDSPAPNNPTFSPGKARALLDRAGWKDLDNDGVREKNGVPFSFTLLLPDLDRSQQRAVTVVQHDLAKAGIQMKITTVSWGVYTDRLRTHKFEAAIFSAPNRAPFDPTPLFHSKEMETGRNFGSFKDAKMDLLLEKLDSNPSPDKRSDIQSKISKRLREMAPVAFTFSPLESVLIKNNIRGIRLRDEWLDETTLWIDRGIDKGIDKGTDKPRAGTVPSNRSKQP